MSLEISKLISPMAVLICNATNRDFGFLSLTSSPTSAVRFIDDSLSDWDEVASQGSINFSFFVD